MCTIAARADLGARALARLEGTLVFVADELGAWLIGVLADAGRKKLVEFVAGTDQERALRQVATAAVELTAQDFRPEGGQPAEELAAVISQVFDSPLPEIAVSSDRSLVEALQDGVVTQLAPLGDSELTGLGVSSAGLLGVPAEVIADKLTENLLKEIVGRGSHGGPLEPLSNQLNHDRTYLQGSRIEGKVQKVLELLTWLLEGHPPAVQRGALATNESRGEESDSAGQIKFRQFVPADLGANCILPHALDDQWVPRSQLRMMEADQASLADLGELRRNVIHREYVRSLITAERIVINRSFLFRNPVISAGYMAGDANRNAFTELLSDGAIVLFLTNEKSPLDSEWAKESVLARDAAKALESIIRSVRAWCVRFSWSADNDDLINAWNGRFAERIENTVRLNHGRFLEDVGVIRQDTAGFRRQLDLLPRLATPSAPVPITRTNLYTEYIVREPRDIGQGKYDFEKPYMIPLKWLFDLVYNSNLAIELQLALATPADSVHRSVIHYPNFFQDGTSGSGFDPSRVRVAVMETIQDSLFRRDFTTGALSVFDTLTLPEVVTIRKSEVWQKYTHAVESLLEEPWLFPHPERGLVYVYRCYDDLIAYLSGKGMS
jgi:hypothetical protein